MQDVERAAPNARHGEDIDACTEELDQRLRDFTKGVPAFNTTLAMPGEILRPSASTFNRGYAIASSIGLLLPLTFVSLRVWRLPLHGRPQTRRGPIIYK